MSIHIFQTLLRKINKSNAHVRRSIQLTKTFKAKSCRLRLCNEIRWSNQYLVLESVKKAYDRGAFDNSIPEQTCPVTLAVVENYLKILKPAYMLNINLQYNSSTIMDTIPGVLKLIHDWENISRNSSEIPKNFCNHLIHFTRIKVDYELNSNLYQVIKNFYKNLKKNIFNKLI